MAAPPTRPTRQYQASPAMNADVSALLSSAVCALTTTYVTRGASSAHATPPARPTRTLAASTARITPSVLALKVRGTDGGGTARPPGHEEGGKPRVLDIVRSGYVTRPAGRRGGGACVRLVGVCAGGLEYALIGAADVGQVGLLGYRGCREPLDHRGLVEQQLPVGGKGSSLHDLGERVELADHDRWHPPAGLADLLERPLHEPFVGRLGGDHPDLAGLVSVYVAGRPRPSHLVQAVADPVDAGHC